MARVAPAPVLGFTFCQACGLYHLPRFRYCLGRLRVVRG